MITIIQYIIYNNDWDTTHIKNAIHSVDTTKIILIILVVMVMV